ncbi:MAG: hypothetical protein HW401_750 [Parcubacteria group bacterium]|nr:hypothetical protein [Parcubacteria group bacterium]
MFTKILFVIIFGVYGWFLGINYPPIASEPSHIQYSLRALFIMCGVAAGLVLGHGVAKFLARFLPYKYKEQEKYNLHPFLFSEETLLLEDFDGNIIYSTDGEKMFARKKEVLSIRIEEGEDPYWSICLPVRASFWGVFADFSKSGNKWSFVVPRANLIEKGYVYTSI